MSSYITIILRTDHGDTDLCSYGRSSKIYEAVKGTLGTDTTELTEDRIDVLISFLHTEADRCREVMDSFTPICEAEALDLIEDVLSLSEEYNDCKRVVQKLEMLRDIVQDNPHRIFTEFSF